MPDIITAAEQDAIAAFLASGGKITKCPTRFCGPVTGAEPMTDGIVSTVREKTAREKWSEAAEKAKRTKRQKTDECKRKLLASDERARRATKNLELVQQRARERVAKKLGKVLCALGEEWTWKNINATARTLGYKAAKNLTQFLREQGHGDKIPPREYPKKIIKGQESQRKKDTRMQRYAAICEDYTAGVELKKIREKHNCGDDTIFRAIKVLNIPRRRRVFRKYDEGTRLAILADYDAMVSIPDMVKKWRVADDTIRMIASDAGRVKRPRVVKKTGHVYAARLSDRDQMIRADYEAYVPITEMCVRFSLGKKAIVESALRAGAKKRKPLPRRPAPSAKDMQISAMYQAGAEPKEICESLDTTPRTVIRALVRCKVHIRDAQMRTREQNKREAAERTARVIELYKQGKTNRQIMEVVGYMNESTPRKIVAGWRKAQNVEDGRNDVG